jgi:hypothetical protein
MVRGARYREIWDLTVPFDYIRKGPPSDQLPLKQLRGRLAFLLMTLVPSRPVGIWRMEVERERWAEDGKSVEVPTKEQTTHGRQGTVLVIRDCEVENWSPLFCYKLARARAAKDGVPNLLWYTEEGKPYKQASIISREVKNLMVEGGIDRKFPAYSSRHALITLLFKLGFSEVEVNAFTGHSNNSHTALNHYFHLDGNWAGKRIVQEALKHAPEVAERVIEEDNRIQRVEEGEEPELAQELGLAEADAKEIVSFEWERVEAGCAGGGTGVVSGVRDGGGKGRARDEREVDTAGMRGKAMEGLTAGASRGLIGKRGREVGEREPGTIGEVDLVFPSDWG